MMFHVKPSIWTGLIILAVGFVAGLGTCQWSQTPPDTTLADSLAATKADFKAYVEAQQAATDRHVAEGLHQDSLARLEAARARQANQRAFVAGRRADSLGAELVRAGSQADSVPILVGQVAALEAERGELRETVRFFEGAYLADSAAAASLRLGVASERGVSETLRTRLEAQERATEGLRRQIRGCRVPLIGTPCPRVGVGYGAGLVDGKVNHGPVVAVILPIR
jgi:hypothetical protein